MIRSLLVLLCSAALVACGPEESKIPEWEWDDPNKPSTPVDPEKPTEPETPAEPNEAIVKAGWTNVSADYGKLPEYINVYKSPDKLQNKKAIAYIAVADMEKGGKFDVLGDIEYCDDANVKNYGAVSGNTPAQFYEKEKAPVIINAGLFFTAKKTDGKTFWISQNLVVRDGTFLAPNQNYWVEDWSASPVVYYYPTIGAFYQKEDGTCSATWTYSRGTDTYCYPQPSEEPKKTPSAIFPSGGKTLKQLKVKTAIGGVGVLLNKGEVMNTWKLEMMNVSSDSNQPRTAIGSTADKKIVFFVCEGRNKTEGVAGLTTADVAEVLKEIGCTEALNLDGGGSSCMLVNGKETIKPSDGNQRTVLTGLKMF